MFKNQVNPNDTRAYQANVQLRRIQELYRFLINKPGYILQINTTTRVYSIVEDNARGNVVVSNSLNRPVALPFIRRQLQTFEATGNV